MDWRDIKEQKPANEQDCICANYDLFSKRYEVIRAILIYNEKRNGFYDRSDSYIIGRYPVTHWMPLPAPPKAQ
jgi:hypothetical protein